MFTISVETSFDASHQLALPDGSKEQLHEHTWAVTADVGSEKLDGMGLVMDFGHLTSAVDNIVSELDNTTLERIEYFRQHNSSAENVAKYIYDKLGPGLPREVRLLSISVVEEPGCSAKFGKG
ncbi:MAG: 6-carboxytetrahydropterin synthase [Planctomycetota bacterium]|nr:MAG: 6-carboxytetrahydropterin synthase [Planctomycetota bacterium]